MRINYVLIPLITIAVAGIGSVATQAGLDSWYARLTKPPGTPPAWMFAPVWTTIYILTTIAVLILWNRCTRDRVTVSALVLLGVNAIANALWSYLFFTLESPTGALLAALGISGTVAAASVLAAVRSWTAAILLLPYVFWALYATYLNALIVTLN
jgi:tryptophan-rich sensory protein